MMSRGPIGRRRGAGRAFSLPELLVALALALVLSAVMVRGLMGLGRSGERLALVLRERQVARRTLALLRRELAASRRWQADAGAGAACGLGGRTSVLHLELDGSRITYSVGQAPSPIWRGEVLMRCGPAYGLAGELGIGAPQNRVVLDGLVPGGLRVEEEARGLVRLELRQEFRLRDGGSQPLRLEARAAGPT